MYPYMSCWCDNTIFSTLESENKLELLESYSYILPDDMSLKIPILHVHFTIRYKHLLITVYFQVCMSHFLYIDEFKELRNMQKTVHMTFSYNHTREMSVSLT